MIHLKMTTATIAFFGLLSSVVPCGYAEGIPWQNDVAEARRMAAEQRKPLLLHFWSESCPPCKKLDRYVFRHPEVARAVNGVVPVKINTRKQRKLAAQFGIRRIPTDVLISPEGRELWRGISPGTVKDYVGMITHAVRQTPVADPAVLSRLAEIARDRRSQFIGEAGYSAGAVADQSAMGRSGTSPPTSPKPPSSTNAQDSSPPVAGGGAFQPDRNSYQASRVAPRAPLQEDSRMDAAANTASPPNDSSDRGMAQRVQPRSNPYFQPAATAGEQQSPRKPKAPGSQATAGPPQIKQAATQPRFALEGYCPVSLVEKHRWIKGDRRWGVIHRGQTYLFSSEDNLKRFWTDPDGFAPMLSGYDPVHFAEQRQWIEGRRQHGVFYKDRTMGRTAVVLFADEAALEKFCRAPENYRSRVRQALQTGGPSTLR